MELIPGSENDIDKKAFTWSLLRFDSKILQIAVNFENPKYISMEAIDYMKVIFNNT